MTDETSDNPGLQRVVTFSFLAVFTVFIFFSFIRYALVNDPQRLTDVDWGYLSIYVAMLGWYATKVQVLKRREIEYKPTSLPGQCFVYATWAVAIVLPFLKINGWWVERVPANLPGFAIAVTVIYGGSRLLKPKKKKKDK